VSATYREGAAMHLPDVNGFPGVIHLSALDRVTREANENDNGRARYASRLYDRDALNGARDLLDTCAFTTPAGDCDDIAIHGRYCPRHDKDD
jgi:hypothetical protein